MNVQHKKNWFFAMISFIVIGCMVFGMPISAYASVTSNEGGIIKGEFKFSPHSVNDIDYTDRFIYMDSYFNASAYEYNPHLATMSMSVAAASISSSEEDYPNKSRNIRNLLADLSFQDFETNPAYTQRPQQTTMGVAAAHKTIQSNGKQCTLLAIVPRSAGYEQEWAGNFVMGETGLHQGFEQARDQVLSFSKDYVARHGISGDVKVWTMGYSRGAGVINVLGAFLIDNPDYLGFTLKPENLYAYTFGTPSTVPSNMNPNDPKYANIFNHYAEYDIVTIAPFSQWGFTRYGTNVLLPVYDAAKKEQMLGFLKNTNDVIYAIYTNPNVSGDPDRFSPKKVEIGAGGIKLVNDDPATSPAESNQKDFLHGRTGFLSETIIPDRVTYVREYQYAIQVLAALNFGLNADESKLFIGGIASNKKSMATAALLYVYYITKQYENEISMVPQMLALLNQMEIDLALDPEFQALIQSAEYQAIKAELVALEKIGGVLADSDIVENIKGFTNALIKEVLTGGLYAIHASQETLAKVTASNVTMPLIDLAAFSLFGSKGETIDAFNIDGDQVKMAATFVGNVGSYMRVHNNEILISWLRTQDSYYNGEEPQPSPAPSPAPAPKPAAKTGDSSNPAMWVMLIAAAGVAITWSVIHMRKRKNKSDQ
ncbi:MAG: hypothetical protein RSA41_08110 [Christensenella sp.]